MTPFFAWLESTHFSVWMRESPSIFAFPGVLCVHALGMALLVGLQTTMALRTLGVAPRIPTSALRRFLPIASAGLSLNVTSGLALLLAYPTKAFTNPLFYLKLFLVIAALWQAHALARALIDDGRGARTPDTARLKRIAVGLLVCWVGAVTAGRFLAYTYSRLLADS